MATDAVTGARVAHHVPGRLRLQLERGADVHAAADRLRTSAGAMPGFQHVEVRSASRSLVVHYSPDQLTIDDLFDKGLTEATIEIIDESARSVARLASRTSIGRQVVTAVDVANRHVEQATEGLVGLRDAFPLTLVGLSIRQIVLGNMTPIPWYNLMYWGYSAFAALHRRSEVVPTESQPDPRQIAARRYAGGEINAQQYRRILTVLESAEVVETAAVAVESGEPPQPAPEVSASPAEPESPAPSETPVAGETAPSGEVSEKTEAPAESPHEPRRRRRPPHGGSEEPRAE